MMKRLIVLFVVLGSLIGTDLLLGEYPDKGTNKKFVELHKKVQELKYELAITKNILLDWQCRAMELETEKLVKQSKRLRNNDKQKGTVE